MSPRITSLLSLVLLVGACAIAPPAPPEELANTLVSELDAGHVEEARKLFALVDDSAEYRDKIYPVLYGAARARYQDGNAAGAAVLLRFLHEGYPEAGAVPEALLYALILERAGREEPDPALAAEIDGLLAELRQERTTLPVWLDLIEAQQAMDRGDPELAREAHARFLGAWDGKPGGPFLAVYVDDIGRHLGPAPGSERAPGGGGQEGGQENEE